MSEDAFPPAAPPPPACPAGDPAAGMARCAAHPYAVATAACARCGAFICVACTIPGPDGIVCPACAARLQQTEAAPWLAITSAGLGFLSIGFAPFGLVAILLAIVDLVRGAARNAPAGGRKLDLIGLGLGLAGCVLWVVIVYRLATDPALVRELAQD
jgi:hypothetical protein